MLDGEKIPVIFLYGFDELLQASGVAQSDYLERVAEFQLREAELGRGAVILITSRTVVIDQTRIPDPSLVLRLKDFDDKQIDAWLETWNTSNSDYYLGDMARQPLLLALLTLFDAGANDLPRDGIGTKRTIIYEKLLELFLAARSQKEAVQLPHRRQRPSRINPQLSGLCMRPSTPRRYRQELRAVHRTRPGQGTAGQAEAITGVGLLPLTAAALITGERATAPRPSPPIAGCCSAVAADSVEPGNRRGPTVAEVRRGSPVRRQGGAAVSGCGIG